MAIINGTSGNDDLFTIASNDQLLGFAGDDVLDALPGKGNNELRGGEGDDELFANTNDRLFGESGNDTLDATDGAGSNLLSGGTGDDRIFASINDRVLGGNGNDIIFAGDGNNFITGGLGRDFFIIAEHPSAANTITDFRSDVDQINIPITANFQALQITQNGNDTEIALGSDTLVKLLNTKANSLNANNLLTGARGSQLQNTNNGTVRIAQFNASLNRNAAGQLTIDLSTPTNQQARNVAEIIQINNPDIVVINEFDFVEDGSAAQLFQQNYLSISQNGANPIDFPFFYIAPSNTGIASGFDLDNNGITVTTPGTAGYGNDAFGFGNFPGQFAFIIYSKFPIITENIRTFQNFLWKDLPNNRLTNDTTIDNPNTAVNENLNGFYSPEEIAVLRLSSKNHVDVPVNINGKIVNLLVSHPTPPVFDGTEDRNGKRNADEIRFFSDYINGADYIYDDRGNFGGLPRGSSFVILGDQNSDPFDGNSIPGSIQQLLTNPNVNSNPSSVFPSSLGGIQQGINDGGINNRHRGNPAFDTADFGDGITAAGNLRADYVLSSQDLNVDNAGVFTPLNTDPLFRLVGERGSVNQFQNAGNTPTSDHSLVFIDVVVNGEQPANRTVTDLDFLGQAVFATGTIVSGTTLGGLSGIAFDAAKNQYYAISDDRGTPISEPGQPPRFYTLNIDLSSGRLASNGVTFTGVTTLKRPDGNVYAALTTDTEAIALTKNGTIFVTSEGEAGANGFRVNPFVNEYNLATGQFVRSLTVPSKFLPNALNLFGLSSDGRQLIQFNNPANPDPNNATTFPISGIVTGETLVGIDIRPLNGLLYGLGINAITNTGTIYLINSQTGTASIATGAAGQVAFVDTNGNPLDLPTGGYGIDFNPTVDRLRVVTSSGLNFRLNPVTGGVIDGDSVALGNNPDAAINRATGIAATAYTNSVNRATVTTQYGLDPFTNSLFIQNPPNSGTQTVPLVVTLNGTTLDFTDVTGFDIAANVQVSESNSVATGVGFASLSVGGVSGLYAIDLSSGAATLIRNNTPDLAGLTVSSVQDATQTTGTRNNLAFESATISPNQKFLFIATENALVQDGTAATVTTGSNVRILKYNLATGNPEQEYLYVADAVAVPPNPSNQFSTSGLVDLLALSNNTFLAVERSFAVGSGGTGNTIKIYEVTIDGATDISTINSLNNLPSAIAGQKIIPVKKRLILDLADLNLANGLDNIEGITFGETLPDGRRSIILVSDNNFNATGFTQFLAFALDELPTVLPVIETPTLIDADDNDLAIYVNPTNVEQSIVIGTTKNAGLQVYNLDGELIQVINPEAKPGDISYNSVDILYGFSLGGQTVDIAVVSDRRNDLLAIFKIDANSPTGDYLVDITSSAADRVFSTNPVFAPEAFEESHTYGLALYKSPVSGKSYVFTSRRNTGDIAQLELVDDGNGGINYKLVRHFTVPIPENKEFSPQVEGMVVDQETGFLYLGQEDVGIWKYRAEPDSSSTGVLIDRVKNLGGNVLESDIEGLTIYYTKDGIGYLLVSIQGNNTFAVYSREGFNDFLGTFTIGINGEIDGVQKSGGADISNISLGSKFPFGLFVIQDGSNDPIVQAKNDGKIQNVATNFKFIPYENVSATFDLVIDTKSYDPRNPTPNSLLNGVASGDTTQTSTVLFARSNFTGDVTFAYSTSANFTKIIATATATVTDPSVPVKVIIENLTPNTTYYYRVTDAAGAVGIGKFNTSAEVGTRTGLRFGATGDWQQSAPFPSLSNADEQNLEFFIKLGDTIYADIETAALPGVTQARTLKEFRIKHEEVITSRFQQNTVADLYASTSILTTIHDHEIVDNFAGGAAPGLSPDAPDIGSSDIPLFTDDVKFVNDTKAYEDALQAHQEFHPINPRFYGATGDGRSAGERKLYRYNTYGSDAASFILDSRSFRDVQLEPASLANPIPFLSRAFNPTRTLLGRVQVDDLKRDLLQAQADGITWKFITIPEPIQNFGIVNAEDRFEGYAAERTEILKFINDNAIANVVFLAGDFHGTIVNNLTYQIAPGGQQIATNAFEVVTGPAAFFDGLFGPNVAQLSAAAGLITPEQLAFYNRLPVATDRDSVVNDRDDFIKQILEAQTAAFGYDPVGLNNNLAIAQGKVDATLLQGDYVAVHKFGWTQFDIDQATQKLTVTTYGIEPYTESEMVENFANITRRTPKVVLQFEVNPKAVQRSVQARGLLVGNLGDNGILAVGQNIVFSGDGSDFVPAAANTTGNSRIYGGAGNDSVQASTGDRLFGQGGDDRLDAIRGKGGNRLYGGDGNDSLFAGTNDRLIGGNGNDFLYAGLGGSTLSGGTGNDVFLLVETILPNAINTIIDFSAGQDNLRVSGLVGISSFANLTLSQQGANTLIRGAGTDLAVLTGIQASSLGANNFSFG